MLRVLLSVGALQLVSMLVMLLRTKGLALMLGPGQYGLMAAVDRLVAVFAQTASLSLPFAALRYLSPLWHQDRPAYLDLFVRMRNVLLAFLSVAFMVGMVLVWVAPRILGADVAGNRILATLALTSLPVVALVPFLQNTVASSFAHNRAMLFVLLNAVVITVASLGGAALWGLRGLYLAYAILGGVLVIAVLRWVRRRAAERPERETGRERALTPADRRGLAATRSWKPGAGLFGYLPPLVWRFCLLLLPSAFLAPAVAYSVFYQVLSAHGARVAGYMQAAIGISLAIRGVLGAASQVFLTPLVNKPGKFQDRLERANEFQKTLFLLVGVVVPPVLLLAGIAIRLLYSTQFLPGARFVAFFVGVEILTLAVGTYQAVLIAMEDIVFYVVQNALAQVIMYVVAVATIPAWGIMGAALAALSAQALLLVGSLAYMGWRYGLRLPIRLVGLMTYVFAVLAASGALAATRPGIGLEAAATKGAFYMLAAALLAGFLTKEDWRNLRRFAVASGRAVRR